MKLVGWIAGAVTALALILFAISNRMAVELRIEPLPFFVELPLYGALLASLVLGFVLGGFVAWFGGRRARRRARRAEGEVRRLSATLAEAARREPPDAPAPGSALQKLPRAS